MNELDRARGEIDRIDAEMAELFARRMKVCERIAAYKRENGLPVRDPEREAAMLRARCEALDDAALAPYYAEFLQGVVALSRRYQAERMDGEAEK